MPGQKYSRQKRYLKRRYAQDAEFRAARQERMLTYSKTQYATNPAFKQRQQASQQDWYARQAALQCVRHLFDPAPHRRRRAARSVDSRLLDFCRLYLAENAGALLAASGVLAAEHHFPTLAHCSHSGHASTDKTF